MRNINSPFLYLVVAPLVTLMMLFLHEFIPSKQLSLLPITEDNSRLFADNVEAGGQSSVSWLNQKELRFSCNLKPGVMYPYCGFVRTLGNGIDEGIDLSQYEGFRIHLNYQGTSRLRLSIRHYSAEFAEFSPANEDNAKFNKYNSLVIYAKDFEDTLDVKLSEFGVADWWINDFNIPRNLSYPEFTNSVDFTIDFPAPIVFGEHQVKIDYIEFYGPLITKEKWYLSIVIFWIVIILTSGVVRIIILNRKATADAHRLQDFIAHNDALKQQAQKYKTLSHIDGLTGALNRHGISRYLSRFYPQDRNSESLAIAIIDLDHFKAINDLHGHDIGDQVLKGTVDTIQQNIRETDRIGRWGGEEFIIICPHTNADQIFSMCDNIRLLIEAHGFGEQDSIHLTMSAGIGISHVGESFEQTFQRIDKALYKAKNSGRNRVIGVN
ncbi:GGDEF domain-containing protein [Alteromonadaceae bacterium BrNp21-10]|nr:GGDEF domain-containing protein [Alteromonadaceae bacterium BrNp21-10]